MRDCVTTEWAGGLVRDPTSGAREDSYRSRDPLLSFPARRKAVAPFGTVDSTQYATPNLLVWDVGVHSPHTACARLANKSAQCAQISAPSSTLMTYSRLDLYAPTSLCLAIGSSSSRSKPARCTGGPRSAASTMTSPAVALQLSAQQVSMWQSTTLPYTVCPFQSEPRHPLTS